MTARKHPEKPGFWWVQFDDGTNYVTGPALAYATKCPDYGDWRVTLADGSNWSFDLDNIENEIVKVNKPFTFAGLPSSSVVELRVHWLREAKPPRAPGKDTILPIELRVV